MQDKNYLIEEANRCLKCRNPKCQQGCPISTPIPQIIDLFQKEEYMEAGRILFENNPLSLVCSLICPFENQCMGNCIRGIKGEPINFPKIENFIMNKYLKETKFENVKSNGKRVAIVGAGPSGISGAFYLRRLGYDVTIYTDHAKMGGMLRYGIPSFRLSKDNVDLLEEKIAEAGIKFIGKTVFTQKSLNELKEFGNYDAVLVNTGAWLPKTLDIKGNNKDLVLYGIDYLKNDIDLGKDKKVVVIGAGNVAMDVARTARRQGNEVTIAYRKTLDRAPATKAEIRETKADGVQVIEEVTPIEILDNGILLQENNSKREFIYECNNVIIAVSQKSAIKIENLEGYFYGGDLLTGPDTVVRASLTGKESAQKIHEFLKDKE